MDDAICQITTSKSWFFVEDKEGNRNGAVFCVDVYCPSWL